MKLLPLLISLISLSLSSQVQEYSLVYDYKLNAKDINLITNIKTYLQGNSQESIYTEDFANTIHSNADTNMMSVKIKGEGNPVFFKDLKKKSITFRNDIKFNFFNIYDLIPNFDWKIEEESKTILGYNCQKAMVHFRGRDFIVYFAPTIPVSDGPWKFFGLPGLILEVKMNSPEIGIDIVAEKIILNPKEAKPNLVNPYLNKEIITYNDFLKIYQQKYEESLHLVNQYGPIRPMNKGRIEVWVKD